jgi:hypothetical protein
MSWSGQPRFGSAAEVQVQFRPIHAPLQQRKKQCQQTGERYRSRQDLPELARP